MAYQPNFSKNQEPTNSDQSSQQFIQSYIAHLKLSILSAIPDAEILCEKTWVYTADKYAFVGVLINKKIVLYCAIGQVRKSDSETVKTIMKAVVVASGREKNLIQILDLSHIRSFSLSARKSYEAINDELSPHWQKSYYIFSGTGNTIFKVYAVINPRIQEQVTLAESIPQALQLYLERVKTGQQSGHPFDPEKASHHELVKRYKELLAAQEKKADLLLKSIAKTSWEEDFEWQEQPCKQGDPFYNVFEALALLKEDLGEIYEQQKQHNRILEEEVDRRISQLSSVIENTSDMIMSVDRDWRVQVVNSSFRKHFWEFQQNDINVGDDLLSLYTSEGSYQYWKSRFERAFAGERFQEMTSSAIDGQEIHFELNYNPIRRSNQSEVTEVSVFGRNITDLRQAEAIAKENELNLTRALRIAKAGSWQLNLFTNEVIIGKEGLKLLGMPDEDKIIVHIDYFIENLLHPDDHALIREKIEYSRSQIDNPSFRDQFQYRLVHQDGSYLHMTLYSRFKSGKRGVIYGISQDVTRQKKAEEKLIQQNASLRKVNSEIDQFVYSVSHDLRAPLASVLGLINISRLEKDPEILHSYLDLKEKSIKKLDNYIQEIIDLSKNARLGVLREPIDFQRLIEDVYEEQHYNQGSQQIQKLVDVRCTGRFTSDYRRLRVVLQNLVSNALRYANLNQESPFVKVSVEDSEGGVSLTVEDNGLGIPAEHQPNIFEMFYRATQEHTGSGLGLYIVKETLDKLGGDIAVSSQHGLGTSFSVKLPDLSDL